MPKKTKSAHQESGDAQQGAVLPPPGAQPEGNEQLLTTRELMAFLNLSRTKVWELVNKQGLPAFKIGGDYRYRRAEVMGWLERYRVQNDEQ